MIFNDVVTAVSRAIFSEFGEGYKIYAEAVEQGLEEPCFFVQCINSTFKKEYENQARMKFFFCVQFFPEDKLNPVRECLNISERLFALLDGSKKYTLEETARIIDNFLKGKVK